MTTKILVVCDPHRTSAKIQALGARLLGRKPHPAMPYHCAWMTDEAIYDMNWTFRELPRDYYEGKNRDLRIFDSPVQITDEYFRSLVGKVKYGTFDVLLYPIFQLVGLNWWGTHCSERINDDLWFHGYRTPWIPYGAPPSPADILAWLEGRS